ncbi:MAG: LacI family DNA-binding transcriptional regulator [Planctomycetota bacterium]
MPANQQTIAEHLGLSVATVSRSLSNHPSINPKTRARVMSAASAMGYKSGRQREAKASASVPTIAAISYGEATLDGYAAVVRNRVLEGMISEARERELSLSLDYVPRDQASRIDQLDVLPPIVRTGQCEGLLIIGNFPGDAVSRLARQLPCVKVAGYTPNVSVDCIHHDDLSSMEMLVDHLWSLGHRRIGFVPAADFTVERIRWSGLVLALQRRGVSLAEMGSWGFEPGSIQDHDTLAERVEDRLNNQGVTAWVAANDAEGYRLMSGLASRGIVCPRDLSVCGFDHFDPPANLPRMTSVEAPFEDLGKLAVARLHQRIRQVVSTTNHTMLSCQLVPGESTGAVPSTQP